jgi:flagellum-specific ATP synthase
VLAVWSDIEDLVNIGAYVPGINADYDVAVRCKATIDGFLRQGVDEKSPFEVTRERLLELGREIGRVREAAVATARRGTGAAQAA